MRRLARSFVVFGSIFIEMKMNGVNQQDEMMMAMMMKNKKQEEATKDDIYIVLNLLAMKFYDCVHLKVVVLVCVCVWFQPLI